MHDKADNWWNGLTPEQRQEAKHAARTGQVSDELWASLVDAGLGDPADEGRTLSDPVLLKMQHD